MKKEETKIEEVEVSDERGKGKYSHLNKTAEEIEKELDEARKEATKSDEKQ